MSSRISIRSSRGAALLALLAACQGPGVTFLRLAAQPAQLSYMTTSPTPPVDQTVMVVNSGPSVVHLTGVKVSQASDLSLPAEQMLVNDCTGQPRTGGNLMVLSPAECATFDVRYTPTVPETLNDSILITSDVPLQPTLTVPVTAVNQWPPPICPNPPEAEISASTSAGPLAPNAQVTPGTVTFSSAGSTAVGSATIAQESWTMVDMPAGNTAALVPGGSSATFDAQTAGAYEVSLTVLDSNGCTSQPVTFPFTMLIPPCWQIPVPPKAIIQATVGGQQIPPDGVLQDTLVSLDGSQSIPGTNPIQGYRWSLVSAPADNTSTIVASGSMATLDCTVPGTYVVQLEVTDSKSCPNATTLAIDVTALPLVCGPSTEFIYAVDTEGNLYRFTPSTLDFTMVGYIDCLGQTGGTVGTMAVDSNGIAGVEHDDGELFRVDTATLQCWPAGFNFGQVTSDYWGSCYAANAPMSTDDTYFITTGNLLATIDPQTLAYREVGAFTGINLANTDGAELTGTSTAQLYGFFATTPWAVAPIDKTTAAIGTPISLQVINDEAPGIFGFAFASWGQDFYFFVDTGMDTEIFHYDASTGSTSRVLEEPGVGIDGAGVSPCVQAE